MWVKLGHDDVKRGRHSSANFARRSHAPPARITRAYCRRRRHGPYRAQKRKLALERISDSFVEPVVEGFTLSQKGGRGENILQGTERHKQDARPLYTIVEGNKKGARFKTAELSQPQGSSGEAYFIDETKRVHVKCTTLILRLCLTQDESFANYSATTKPKQLRGPPSPPAPPPRHTLQPLAVEACRTLRGPSSASAPPGWNFTAQARYHGGEYAIDNANTKHDRHKSQQPKRAVVGTYIRFKGHNALGIQSVF